MGKRQLSGLIILLFAAGYFSFRGTPAFVAARQGGAQTVDFARDIQPLLQTNCIRCHGPQKAMGQLRLDDRVSAARVIVAGNSKASRLLQRVLGESGEARMPMGGEPLSEAQITLLRRWLDEGAVWNSAANPPSAIRHPQSKHWSFINPTRPALPEVKNKSWPRNPIDYFVLARLEREGLQPSPAAGKATLLRRVSFDLTGLPPTLAELDAFLNDQSPNAYEKVVDRLLASPRYGERMAYRWLDAARYADTNGYQVDGWREAWRWRDWVIEAFNQNKPFDQFVTEQLAGDLLPNATLDQQIATAFNRNHRINAEGGIVPEEYRNEYVVDRVDTTATVFMGLTVGCARCHSHKFDPISQREFYQLAAFFNSIDEDGHSFDQGNSPPIIKAPTREQQQQLEQLQRTERQQAARVQTLLKTFSPQQTHWAKTLKPGTQWFDDDELIVRLALDENAAPVFNKSKHDYHNQYDRRPGEKPLTFFDIGFKEGAPRYVAAPTGQGVAFDGKLYFDAGIHANFRYNSPSEHFNERFTIAAWVKPASEQSGTILGKVSDAVADVENGVPRAEGYGLYVVNGKLHFNMVFRWGEDTLRVETEDKLALNQWQHIAVVFDSFAQWDDRVRIYVNGRAQRLTFNQRNFFLLFAKSKDTLKIGAGGGPAFRFKGALDEVRLYTRGLNAEEVAALACGNSLERIAALPLAQRTPAQTLKLTRAFIALAAPQELKDADAQWQAAKHARQAFEDELPTLMVMQELPAPRPQFLLKRGNYDAPGEEVQRGVLSALNPWPAGAPRNRLGLAQWLVSDEHPLTARVTVNRFWQMFFGAGLVKTAEDFGAQSEPPSHPELLDWLAVAFRDGIADCGLRIADCRKKPWDMKALLKTIVMSATYRQSSAINPQSAIPNPQLLARGPRLRLSAEMIRDQALFVAGLLVEKIGGPSVKPYQPDGFYRGLASTGYERDKGEGLWRRSLYTFWKRTILSPTMQVFDASAREFCNVREVRTNTPLQSLNLMNDVTYLEAARLLAERALKEGGATPEQRLAWAFRTVTSRLPDEQELRVLARGLAKQRETFAQAPQNAAKLLASGERRNDASLNQIELAAYAVTMSLLFNLDETITKQ